eukprot:CAMPEP_0119008598 /NCGR_PEP_ID=MMETSP1176-20130426/3812_1 /TAXON_ID=265551 /ORGANISM="Synedropsis recta cf, Strain CCMP1620" /LENGTH=481 /DNA_ID=CAMNT_0006960959 /DNA_START=159 /DNA_END=1604 /DNA_ORIENTATION=+
MFAIAPPANEDEWATSALDRPSNLLLAINSVTSKGILLMPPDVSISGALTNTTNTTGAPIIPTRTTTTAIRMASTIIPDYYRRMLQYDNVTLARMRNLSSVDYFVCCGLGHRLAKNVDAYYLASRVLNFSLRVHWSYCEDNNNDHGRHEVSQYLFGPQPPSMVDHVTSTGSAFLLQNDVKGFRRIVRQGPKSDCMCPADNDKYWSDVEYYRSLRERFRLKPRVDDFVKTHFAQHSVLGIHVRAGNNEGGDFVKKHRIIERREQWVQNVVNLLVNLTTSHDLVKTATSTTKPPLLYIATDTPSMITMFSAALEGIMPVVEFPQRRPAENKGVVFGRAEQVQKNGTDCLTNWENVVMDMMLLSHADVIVAARPSSFSQSLPMSLAYATKEEHRIFPKPFCEVNYNATDIRCYKDFQEWCCEGDGQFSLAGLTQRYEYLRMPPSNVRAPNYKHPSTVKIRPQDSKISTRHVYQDEFLPYEYDDD